MDHPQKNYWQIRLENIKASFEQNNFEVFIAPNGDAAHHIVLEQILPRTQARKISWGGSMTFIATKLYHTLNTDSRFDAIDTFSKKIAPEEMMNRRRQALLADLFITGTNAVTETGQLVNLDMIGNRVAALTFGPKNVVVLAGRNKIVPDVEAAKTRIRKYTAPVNAMRLDKQTPCVKTGQCLACSSPERICNTWTITEKSFPENRIKIILINEDLGI